VQASRLRALQKPSQSLYFRLGGEIASVFAEPKPAEGWQARRSVARGSPGILIPLKAPLSTAQQCEAGTHRYARRARPPRKRLLPSARRQMSLRNVIARETGAPAPLGASFNLGFLPRHSVGSGPPGRASQALPGIIALPLTPGE
jgi:hypothetical protein